MAGNIKINYKLNLQLVLRRKLGYDWVKYRLQAWSKKLGFAEIELLHKVLYHLVSVILNITVSFIFKNVDFRFPSKTI